MFAPARWGQSSGADSEVRVSTIVAVIVGVALAAATIAGVTKSVTDHGHHSSSTPVNNAALYGSN
jgi:hypothetical protein